MAEYTVVYPIGDRGCTATYVYRERELVDGEYVYSDVASICYTCPFDPAQPAVPQQVSYDYQLGWNSSAYSVQARSDDCFTEFSVPSSVGVVCGFAPHRASNHPNDIPHGFYCYKNAGREYWVVVERGVSMTSPVVRDPGTDVFRIERRRGEVRFFHNGKTQYVSTVPAVGTLRVVACMYSALDGVD